MNPHLIGDFRQQRTLATQCVDMLNWSHLVEFVSPAWRAQHLWPCDIETLTIGRRLLALRHLRRGNGPGPLGGNETVKRPVPPTVDRTDHRMTIRRLVGQS